MTAVLVGRQSHCSFNTSESLVNVLLNHCSRKKNILKRPNSFLTFGRSYKTYRFYSLPCIIGHSPGNCFFFQQVLHQPQPSPGVSQELPAGTQMLASLSQALPALLAQLIFLVACISTLPCFLLQLLAGRKEEDFSYPFLLSGRDV